MITVVLYALIAIGLAGAAGYAVMSFFEASQTTTHVQENMSRMETVVSTLRANLRAVAMDGVALPPMGDTPVGDYTGVPGWIGVPDRTPWNVRYAYCPYSPDTALSGVMESVVMPDGDSYEVNLQTAGDGRDYVLRSESPTISGLPSGAGILALVVSSGPKSPIPPSCADVRYENGQFVVAGGSVKAVTTGIAFTQKVFSSTSKVTLYVDAAGTGQGSSSADPADLATAISIWQTVHPRVMEIVMAPGVYALAATDLSPSSVLPEDAATLVLRDDTASRADTVLTLSGASGNPIPAQLFVRNITIAGEALTIQGHGLVAENAILPPVVVNGGSIDVLGMVDFVSDAGPALDIRGATLFVPPGSVLSATVPSGATAVYLRSGTLRMEGELDIVGSSGNPSVGVDLGGTLDMPSGARLLFPSNPPMVGVRMSEGGVLKLASGAQMGTLSARPDVAAQDVGGLSVFGTGHVYATSDCWSGRMFDASEEGTMAGDSSEPQVVVEPASWPEIPDYVLYQALSTVNHSDWTCN
ncbi:MAG TPA: hypothetical protein DCW68_05280 [Rhodospirillaceae bacterium]|nr:MAG: hypothetical protein A2018_02370 [Alphaproteobacteria bacterium GWF2_58_20]HAU29507.1 hypothetical protein [Rhodospirillaceae bacterium]